MEGEKNKSRGSILRTGECAADSLQRKSACGGAWVTSIAGSFPPSPPLFRRGIKWQIIGGGGEKVKQLGEEWTRIREDSSPARRTSISDSSSSRASLTPLSTYEEGKKRRGKSDRGQERGEGFGGKRRDCGPRRRRPPPESGKGVGGRPSCKCALCPGAAAANAKPQLEGAWNGRSLDLRGAYNRQLPPPLL